MLLHFNIKHPQNYCFQKIWKVQKSQKIIKFSFKKRYRQRNGDRGIAAWFYDTSTGGLATSHLVNFSGPVLYTPSDDLLSLLSCRGRFPLLVFSTLALVGPAPALIAHPTAFRAGGACPGGLGLYTWTPTPVPGSRHPLCGGFGFEPEGFPLSCEGDDVTGDRGLPWTWCGKGSRVVDGERAERAEAREALVRSSVSPSRAPQWAQGKKEPPAAEYDGQERDRALPSRHGVLRTSQPLSSAPRATGQP